MVADKRNQRREDVEGGKVSIVMPHAETAVCFTDTDTTISSLMKSTALSFHHRRFIKIPNRLQAGMFRPKSKMTSLAP
jgi:hypothetical protein